MISAVVGWAHPVLIGFWNSSLLIGFLVLVLVLYFGFKKHHIFSSSFHSGIRMSLPNDDGLKQQSTHNGKKSYAAFLIDRPFNNQAQREKYSSITLMNCLRYRLRIALNSETSGHTEVDFSNAYFNCNDLETAFLAFNLSSPLPSTNSSLTANDDNNQPPKNNSLCDTLLRLVNEFDATGIAEIFRLLLERRTAIPLFVPESKEHYLSLLRHITLPGIDNIRLGEDKSLLRVALISFRQRDESQTCDILNSVFNIDSIHSHDLTTSNISSEAMLAEMGCGCVLVEGPGGSQTAHNVLVVHVIGDFRPLWSFLRRFADYYLIEDSTVDSENFFSSFMTEEKKRATDLEDQNLGVETKKLLGCFWKPSYGKASLEVKEINGFVHMYIQDQLSLKTLNLIKRGVVNCIKETLDRQWLTCATKRTMLSEIPILESEGYASPESVSSREHEYKIAQLVENLEKVKKNEFLLQKNFLQEAKHQEAKMENRLNDKKVNEEDGKIKVFRERRRAATQKVEKNPLLQLFLSFLENKNPCSRVLCIREFQKELSKCGEQELGPLLATISSLTTSYYEKLSNAFDARDLESAKEKLHKAKTNLIESALNIEHLWRELSHLYTDMEPERRSPKIMRIPLLAAQHLMDGFCLELLDGESNLIHMEWVTKVLQELGTMMKGKRIFVLSVMGVQSSGKSTLLNTMFGIRMRTSVGQCTRGVNMQLLAVEGRPEYDYILLLDTEGTRSPEYHGLAGSEKRDNQMATLSILLSDATIVVIPGENDAAVKEILPIVLMAYQGSQLAEDNGGRLSSMMFFVYNRIDTKQKNKLDTIIQTLGTSLHEAFNQVQRTTGNLTNLKSESPFANFKLVTSDSSGSDVCILGNVKKQSEPPGDVPDEAYGEELIRFREHIHQRVTNVEGGKWESRSIGEFSTYIEKVWKCICSANFIFTFSTVMEHIAFDKLDFEYKKVERKLAEAYQESFNKLKTNMIKLVEENNKSSTRISGDQRSNNENPSISIERFENDLRNEIFPTENDLNQEVNEIVKKRGREKWSLQFQNMWENNKKDQALNWKLNVINAFNRLFNYERHVEKYKKKTRHEINELFKSSNSNDPKWTEQSKNKKFEEMFETILDEAKEEFPPKDVPAEIRKVYQNSNVIRTRQIEIKSTDYTDPTANGPSQSNLPDKKDDKVSWFSYNFFKYFKRPFSSLPINNTNEAEKKNQNSINLCFQSVHDTVSRIAAGKLCYDDSIINNVIHGVDSTIKTYNLTENSVVQNMHDYGMVLIVDLMQKIEKQWEKENSVSAKLESNKEVMHKYFVMVSQGVAKTKLFAATMAAILEKSIISVFEKEMVQKTFKGIRNERWLYDARFMQKHMDLYLIGLLEKQKVKEVLDHLRNPKEFYTDVLHRLIVKKVPNIDEEWQNFRNHLKQAIEKASLALTVDIERAQTFVDQLRKEVLEGYLKSETLGSAFLIDCSDEYKDCDNEEKTEFQEACATKLREVLEKQTPIGKQENYAKELSPKVVQHMIILNDKAALPRCDACCYMCNSLCIEAANHDTQDTPHDAVHQPGGVAGVHYHQTEELDSMTCSQSYEQDCSFYMNKDYTVKYKFRDYATVFRGWKDPRINDELPLREYILATYNEEIANKYGVNPSSNIPASYFRDLSTIKEKLETEIANG